MLTVGDIAAAVSKRYKRPIPKARVAHILDTRPYIEPAGRAGIVRLYRPEVVDLVVTAIAEQDKQISRRAKA